MDSGGAAVQKWEPLEYPRTAVEKNIQGTVTVEAILDATGELLPMKEETSGSAHSSVIVDQFSGQPLAVHNFLTNSAGYRWIRLNRSIHTGDIAGLTGHIIMSLSSLLLVGMVITGVVIWLKKLAV